VRDYIFKSVEYLDYLPEACRRVLDQVRVEREREQALADLQAKTEELRATTQQLWQAARLAGVGELAASIAHELNNPLGTISLRIEGVLFKTPSDDPRRPALMVIDQEIARMARLVSNLLQFSRAGREQVSTVDVCQEVTKTIELTEHHCKRRGIRVEPEFAHNVPIIHADRQQLRQVFLNLFTNSADAMPSGGRLMPRVRIGALPEAQPAVVVEVADTGVGIPAEYLARVTEPFFTTKEEGMGTGLGLAICRRIVRQHRGTLEIESESGKGTTVRVTLPVKSDTNVSGLRHEL
jgi:signal transduction histidine kinase